MAPWRDYKESLHFYCDRLRRDGERRRERASWLTLKEAVRGGSCSRKHRTWVSVCTSLTDDESPDCTRKLGDASEPSALHQALGTRYFFLYVLQPLELSISGVTALIASPNVVWSELDSRVRGERSLAALPHKAKVPKLVPPLEPIKKKKIQLCFHIWHWGGWGQFWRISGENGPLSNKQGAIKEVTHSYATDSFISTCCKEKAYVAKLGYTESNIDLEKKN